MTLKRSLFIFGLSGTLVWTSLAGVQQDVERLIPQLAAEDVSQRHAPRMELQAVAADASRPGAEPQRLELAKVLAAKAIDPAVPQPARVWIVRQLEHVGAAESVPALSQLLRGQDQELRECARRALEKNSAPAASEALRNVLEKEQGWGASFTIGLIHSLGQRQDAQAASLIAGFLTQPDLRRPAATALGMIASDDALRALWRLYDVNVVVAGDALLTAGGQSLRQGKKQGAAAIYRRLYDQCPSTLIRPAALVGLAAADPEAAEPKLLEALRGSDRLLQVAAVTAGRQIYGKNAPAHWAELLPEVSTSAKLLLLHELQPDAETPVLELVTASEPELRVAALETLGLIGGSSSVPTLVKCAAENQQIAKNIATVSLARLSGPGVDEALLKLAGGDDAALRPIAIAALGARACRPAVPRLLAFAGDSDGVVSAAACSALGKLATDAEIDALAKLALANVSGAENALQSVLGRSEDKTGASKKLLAMAKSAQPDQLPLLFSSLAILGTELSLETLTRYAAANQAEAQDAAVRALASWPDFAAAPELLKLASTPTVNRVHNALALQGVARLIRVSDSAPAGDRVDAALQAIKVAQRDEEKKLAVSALGSVPDRKAAEALKQLLSDASLKEASAQAAITLANTLRRSDRRTAEDLVRAIKAADVSPALKSKADAALER